MRIAYLECFSGISVDMFMGALIDAVVPPRALEEAVEALGVGARLEISRVVRSGISATKVDVWVDGGKDLPREEHWAMRERDVEPPSRAEAHHDHEHHDHQHSPGPEAAQAGEPAPHEHSAEHGRGLNEILEIIGRAPISD